MLFAHLVHIHDMHAESPKTHESDPFVQRAGLAGVTVSSTGCTNPKEKMNLEPQHKACGE